MDAPTNAAIDLAMAEAAEIAAMFPEPVMCEIGKVSIPVLPMKLADCMGFAKKMQPIIAQALAGADLKGFVDSIKAGNSIDVGVMLPAIIAAAADHQRDFIEALALGTGKSAAYIGAVPWTAFIPITSTIFTVNVDFFTQNVGSLAPDVLATLKAGNAGDGQTH